MSDINWQENAVCYASSKQWFNHTGNYLMDSKNASKDTVARDINSFIEVKDFKLNEIRTGDYIAASELDTEQKYNDVVEVFGLFGIKVSVDHRGFCAGNPFWLTICNDGYAYTDAYRKRQLTYNQIIAIGKLKRMMLEREKCGAISGEDSTVGKHKSAVDYLTECAEVQKQRGEQYDSSGTGERSFSACADAYNAITGGNLKGSDICLILQILKDVRQYSNPSRLHEDSVLDKVSYSSLHAEELNKELK